jgi:hypothetical protein
MRDQRHAELIGFDVDQRETHAVDRDRALAGDLASKRERKAEPHCTPVGVVHATVDGAHGVDMAGDEVSANRVADLERAFDVHAAARLQLAEIGPREGFFAGLKGERVAVDRDHRQTTAVERDAVADRRLWSDARLADHQPHARRLGNNRRHFR